MPQVNRDFEITYGTYTVGGTTDKLIDASLQRLRIERRYLAVSVEFDFIVTGSSYAAFKTACNDAEVAFAKPRQRLQIKLGASTIDDYNPTAGASGNSGFDAAPSIQKIGDVADTGLSRRYRARVEVATPADLTGQSGRGDSAIEVAFSPSRRRTVTITGFYTALTSNDARAQYNAQGATYAASVLTTLGGTYELVEEVAGPSNDSDKRIEFRRVYEEVLLNQASGTLDHADIARQSLVVFKTRVAPGDTPGSGAERLHELRIGYEAFFDKTAVTDLHAAYTGTVRPWILQHLADTFGASSTAIIEEAPEIDAVNRVIRCSMRVLAVGGSAVVAHVLVREIREQKGKVFIPVWNGDPYAAYVFVGHSIRLRTTTTTTTRLGAIARASGTDPQGGGPNRPSGAVDPFSFFGAHDGSPAGAQISGNPFGFFGAHPGQSPSGAVFLAPAGGNAEQKAGVGDPGGAAANAGDTGEAGWVLIEEGEARAPRRIGLPDVGGLIDVEDLTTTRVERFVTSPSGGGGRVQSGLGLSLAPGAGG